MTDELIPAEGISRRDMLKRSAIVGSASAMVWAAPSLTTFAPRAFGDNGTPASEYSNFGAVIYRTSAPTVLYKVKADYVGPGATDVAWKMPGELGGCEIYVPDWNIATGLIGPTLPDPNGGTITFVRSGDDYIMTLPEGWAFKTVSNGVEAAAASLKQGVCCIGAILNAPNQVTWDGPFPNKSPCTHPQRLGEAVPPGQQG
jgi:hypothetical protein